MGETGGDGVKSDVLWGIGHSLSAYCNCSSHLRIQALLVTFLLLRPLFRFPPTKVIRGDFRDRRVEAEMFALLADQDDTPASRSPLGQNAINTPPPGELPTSDGEALEDKLSHDREAFLRRGTSSSSLLLPRPAVPARDSLEEFLPAGVSKPKPISIIGEAHKGAREKEAYAQSERENSSETASVSRVPQRKKHAEVLPNARDGDSAVKAVRKRRATVVLSDMAPAFGGDHDTDQARVAGLVLDALAACLGDESRRTWKLEWAGGGPSRGAGGHNRDLKDNQLSSTTVDELPGNDASEEGLGATESGAGIGLLARGGTFLGKFFAGRDEREVKGEAERLFQTVKVVKPPASRSGSSEMYILATGFLLGQKRS